MYLMRVTIYEKAAVSFETAAFSHILIYWRGAITRVLALAGTSTDVQIPLAYRSVAAVTFGLSVLLSASASQAPRI